MPSNYDSTNLATSDKDRARFQLGDKGQLLNEAGAVVWLLQDEEIQGLLDTFGYAEGVAQCADALAAQFAQEPTLYEDQGGVKIDMRDRVSTWRALAVQLRKGGRSAQAPTGGAYVSAQIVPPDMTEFR